MSSRGSRAEFRALLLGVLAVTLAAALYTFLYRFWGGMPAALQAGVVDVEGRAGRRECERLV